MVNLEHVEVVKRGAKAIAEWRVSLGVTELLDLAGATLRGADLSDANLAGADLAGADLTGADLRGANLFGANLTVAHLNGANLNGANLTWANITGANLTGASLASANLSDADLSDADFTSADLLGVIVGGVKLTEADLRAATEAVIDLSHALRVWVAAVATAGKEGGVGDGDRLTVTVSVPPAASKEEIKRFVAELTDHLDKLHRASGGSGLTIEDMKVVRDAQVRERV